MALRANHCTIVSHPKFAALNLVMVRFVSSDGTVAVEKKYLPHEAEQMFYEMEQWSANGITPTLDEDV